ncbi:MAG TPA: AraC family transcriptional regulator [Fimbriimonas sp.]|nr:AraC family transcriptional regulator [Fimbriimonas sp.]
MPPRESSAAEYHYHKILANVIEEVLRRKSGRVTVPELASTAGFSRYHLARLFHYMADETLEQFLRRIRLERAAYMLLHTNQRIFQIAMDSGYQSPEAFSRAFRKSYGCLPTKARGTLTTWELPASSDLHWNADWVLDQAPRDFDDQIVQMPLRYAVVVRAIGDYANLADSWSTLQFKLAARIPVNATFITIYRDNLFTHPVCRTLRADLGWLCGREDAGPAGMRKTVIPAGSYAATRFVERSERTDAWSHMWGRYRSAGNETLCYDEYNRWPLPFDEVKTRLLVSLTRNPPSKS